MAIIFPKLLSPRPKLIANQVEILPSQLGLGDEQKAPAPAGPGLSRAEPSVQLIMELEKGDG